MLRVRAGRENLFRSHFFSSVLIIKTFLRGGVIMKKILLAVSVCLILALGVFVSVKAVGHNSSPAKQARVTAVEDCSWGEIKECFSGGHNHCCPKDKGAGYTSSSQSESLTAVTKCTWGEIKECYAGVHNRCCPKDKGSGYTKADLLVL